MEQETAASVSANLALEFVRVTERAAIASARWIGKGDGLSADKAAVDAMRERFNQIDFNGVVVIGEGAKDESHELYVGERLGSHQGAAFDIAVDPLECTASVAYGRPNALAVIATGPKGSLYAAADSYMKKIAVGPEAASVINLDASVADNLIKIAHALGKDISEVTVATLDRPRHKGIIEESRSVGARVRLFTDGDIAMAVATCLKDSPIDVLLGIGGSAEAVLAAPALKCLGGNMYCQWKPKDDKHIKRLADAGITDFSPILSVEDLARGKDTAFIATGVIGGPLLEGVVFAHEYIITHSVIISSNPKSIRFLTTHHM